MREKYYEFLHKIYPLLQSIDFVTITILQEDHTLSKFSPDIAKDVRLFHRANEFCKELNAKTYSMFADKGVRAGEIFYDKTLNKYVSSDGTIFELEGVEGDSLLSDEELSSYLPMIKSVKRNYDYLKKTFINKSFLSLVSVAKDFSIKDSEEKFNIFEKMPIDLVAEVCSYLTFEDVNF